MKDNVVTLYKRAKNSKVSVWSVWIEQENGVPVIVRESGYTDGKKTQKKKYIRKGTNVGKANEKSPLENALFTLTNMVTERIEDNFVRDIGDIDLPPKYLYPALAISDIKKIKYPAFVQPKFNGARAVSFRHLKDARILSRNRKEFAGIDHIEENLELFYQYSPDGEIYRHGFSFQQIISLLKKKYKKGQNKEYPDSESLDLQYHIYDLAIPGMPYLERKRLLDKLIPDNHIFFKKVQTEQVNSWEEVKKWHDIFVARGYEGIIIRNKDAEYAFNDRNESLIKYKEFIDEEFKIVDFEKEEYDDTLNNRMLDLVVWVLETKGGKRFNARPNGSVTERVHAYKNAKKEIGKMGTVKFQEYSEDGVPIFPVFLGVRDYE